MEIQSFCKMVGEWGCLCFCYFYCAGVKDDFEKLKLIEKAHQFKIIDNECTVIDATKLLAIAGKIALVTKKDITSLSEIKEATPVRFDNGNFSHWVVVENGKIVYDTLDNSVCVNKGKPTTARIIKFL